MLPVSLWMLINSYWFNHWLKQHWQCQVTSMGALWGEVGLVHWPMAVLRQGRLHKWNVLSPSLMKIWTSLIGRQRLCSLYGDQKWAECALNVNSLCSPHVREGAKGEDEGLRGHNTLQTQSSGLVAISVECPEGKWKGHRIWSQVTRVEFLNLLLSNLSQKQIS